MCGITGIVEATGQPVDRERLLAMCRTLHHRGPDGEGVFLDGSVGLAMRRLAVVDVAGGHQPVRNEAGTVHAVVNGEIYNHRSLRQELRQLGHTFTSDSDCEVVPHLYEEYGKDFVSRLEGMFAIALWDTEHQRLLLSRDRAGVKPLYYFLDNRRVVFGSEIRAVLAGLDGAALDPQALSDYLSLMYIPGPRSIYSDVRKLEPGRTLVWQDGTHTVRRYWDLAADTAQRRVSADRAMRSVRELLSASVEEQLMGDVPLGFFLSGGLDSGSVVATARRLHPDAELKTFTIGFADRSYDERQQAALVARHLRTTHTELVVEPTAEDVVDRIAPTFDEPFADPSMIPTYYLCELARSQVTVALSGDGGDELFAGYRSYQADKIARYYRHLPRGLTTRLAPSMLRFLPVSHNRASLEFKARRFVDNVLHDPARSHYLWRVVFHEEHKARLLHPDLYAGLLDTYDTHARHDLAGRSFDRLTGHQYTDANVYLAEDVLAKTDRTSMAHSLEVRVPLLSTPLMEYAFSLRGSVKMPGYQPKRLLREAMRHALPPSVLTMGKKGFNAPMPRWLTGPLRPLLDEYLSRDVLRRQGYLQPDEVARWVGRHLDGTAEHGRELWILLMFSMWVEEHKAHR
ncbi:asparagine synthase (glutamine-hydrolyzing) [Catellatospora sp. KI3]|uniref:asparagine synthase (glutamine-hydrolyzing) n=1 Tax=Catellatospora sp. KI3 TaxID=3041620 RepID=UPI0024821B74|nr:asparagine synthase (glutamine-hydrolyzing) [Catellatospora sp. KI3]MDI1460667.1 asparagine synthase (glutamine-hydrolyzing) [Catellatospora sp. KI3]